MVNQPSEPRLIVTSESGRDVSKMQKCLDGVPPATRRWIDGESQRLALDALIYGAPVFGQRAGKAAQMEATRQERRQRAIERVMAKRRGLAWVGFGLACHPWPGDFERPRPSREHYEPGVVPLEPVLTITATGANVGELCSEARWVDEQGRQYVATAHPGTVEAAAVSVGDPAELEQLLSGGAS